MSRRRPSPKARTPQWFELYNPRGGVPRETLPGYRRARELATAIFDRALSLLDEPAGEIDLASALAVLGSIDDDGEYDYDEARADADDLPFLVGTVDWSPEEVGDLLAAVMDTESRGGIVPDVVAQPTIAGVQAGRDLDDQTSLHGHRHAGPAIGQRGIFDE